MKIFTCILLVFAVLAQIDHTNGFTYQETISFMGLTSATIPSDLKQIVKSITGKKDYRDRDEFELDFPYIRQRVRDFKGNATKSLSSFGLEASSLSELPITIMERMLLGASLEDWITIYTMYKNSEELLSSLAVANQEFFWQTMYTFGGDSMMEGIKAFKIFAEFVGIFSNLISAMQVARGDNDIFEPISKRKLTKTEKKVFRNLRSLKEALDSNLRDEL